MTRRDFGLMALACLLWGANLPLTRWLAADIPPLFLASLRFGGVALCLFPYLLRSRGSRVRMMLAGFFLGGLQFALQYLGVARAPASSAAIAAQLALPFTVLLSVVTLHERPSAWRLSGTMVALIGGALVVYHPGKLDLSLGLWLVVGSALAVAIGTILMKKLPNVGALEFQAWSAIASVIPLGAASGLLEEDQWQRLAIASPWQWAGIAYSVLLSAIAGQVIYFGVVKRNDVSLVTPLLIMTPLSAVAISNLVLGEQLDPRVALGAGVTLAGVLMVALPRSPSILPRKRTHKIGPEACSIGGRG